MSMLRRTFAVWLLAGLVGVAAASAQTPDAQTIIQRSTAATKADWAAASQYTFDETDKDASGGTKTYHVTMLYGSPYYRLTGVNGHRLPPGAAAQEEQKLEAATARRRAETSEERAERLQHYEHEQAHEHLLMEQMTLAFNFRLLGTRRLNGHQVYVLRATPRPGYNPPNFEAQALTGMQGTMWIDTKTYQWVRVKAEVKHPVSIEGFLARVEPGTRFMLEKEPVGHGIWLRTRFTMRSKSIILFFFTHRTQEDDTFFNYKRIPER